MSILNILPLYNSKVCFYFLFSLNLIFICFYVVKVNVSYVVDCGKAMKIFSSKEFFSDNDTILR